VIREQLHGRHDRAATTFIEETPVAPRLWKVPKARFRPKVGGAAALPPALPPLLGCPAARPPGRR
jgi:hypothetical protein